MICCVCVCMPCSQDLFHCHSASASFPLSSRPWCYHPSTSSRRAARCHPRIGLAVDSPDSLARDQAEEDGTNLTSKSEAESRKLQQLQEWSLDFIATSLYFDGVYLAISS